MPASGLGWVFRRSQVIGGRHDRDRRTPSRRPHDERDDRRTAGHRRRGHHDLRRRQAGRRGHPGAVPQRALRPRRGLPDVRGRHRRAGLRRGLRAPVRGRHGGQDGHRGGRAQPRGAHRAADVRPAAARRGPQGHDDPRQPAARAGRRLRRRPGDHRAAVRLGPGHRLVQPGHRRRPRRLHPVRPLRAGLRRHPGQRRHRPLRQGLRDPDRLRPERPDGRQLVRHLRRVRAGLPDRGADQQADPGHPDPPARGARRRRQRLPVLRGRLRADLLRRPRARRDLLRRGPRPARLAEQAVREGPLRLGLRRVPAAADRAADPDRLGLPEGPALGGRPRRQAHNDRGRVERRRAQRRRPQGRAPGDKRGGKRKPGGLVDYDEVMPLLPGGHLGRGPRPGRPPAARGPRRRRAGRHRRLRLGQVLQRGGLPLPEADPHRLRHEQRRPLHPALPRLLGVRAVRGRRLRGGVHHLRRRGQRRLRDHHRLEPDGQPPGGQLVLQAGPPPRHQGHLRRPAGVHGGRARRHLRAAQAGHRRGVLQRGDARGHPARADRPGVHRRTARRTTTSWPARSPTTRRSGPPRSPAWTRTPSARSPGLWGEAGAGGHLLGDGDLPAHHRHRQRPLPDRAVLDHRQRRAPGHRAAPAARAEQRAGRLGRRAGPDVLPRLPGRGRRHDPAAVRAGLGHRRSTRSAG